MLKKTFNQLPKPHKWLISAFAFIFCISLLLPSETATASRNSEVAELEIGKRYDLPVDLTQFPSEEWMATNDHEWQSFEVRKGDNLAKIFQRAGLTPQDTYKISKSGNDAKALLKMMPGDNLDLLIDQDGNLQRLRYSMSATDTLELRLNDEGNFVSEIEEKAVDIRLNYAQGEVENSFWNAGMKARLTDNQIMSVANIFGWDIDFALELRKGDSFYVLYEEKYIDGEFAGFGDILAAQFVNQGETYTAIRYSDGNYYTPEGRSMRKSFLRAPVNFKYISSNFKNRRFHPVQQKWKAHRGVDYAADTGTPVIAAGDGRVIKSAYDKYNGNHVFIQHGEKYVTKYLHFSKRAVKVGQNVKQGQVIGYVGSTGLASGPHLHYEFLVNGVHQNPRTVQLPKAAPIAKSEATAFAKLAEERLALLNNNKRIMLAMNN